MPNTLEEKLRAVQTHKASLKKQMKDETDRRKLIGIAEQIACLTAEEKELLRQLGVD